MQVLLNESLTSTRIQYELHQQNNRTNDIMHGVPSCTSETYPLQTQEKIIVINSKEAKFLVSMTLSLVFEFC